jgi:hypothetical protein
LSMACHHNCDGDGNGARKLMKVVQRANNNTSCKTEP